jgi:putative DNA primase/helicase
MTPGKSTTGAGITSGNVVFGDNCEPHPCLLALARDIISDEPRAIYRTALTPDARKIARKAKGPIAGTAVKLFPDDAVSVAFAIGEGLETAIAGAMFGFRPVWALGNALNIRRLPVLEGVQTLTVITDHDLPDKRGHCAGQEAAFVVRVRWTYARREAGRVMPDIAGQDMADLVGV